MGDVAVDVVPLIDVRRHQRVAHQRRHLLVAGRVVVVEQLDRQFGFQRRHHREPREMYAVAGKVHGHLAQALAVLMDGGVGDAEEVWGVLVCDSVRGFREGGRTVIHDAIGHDGQLRARSVDISYVVAEALEVQQRNFLTLVRQHAEHLVDFIGRLEGESRENEGDGLFRFDGLLDEREEGFPALGDYGGVEGGGLQAVRLNDGEDGVGG
jgi:hypothetical protein